MRRFFCVLFSALCLSACVPRVELAFMAVCLGVDAGAEGITLTVKCPDYSGGDKKESAGYAVLSATGADWPRAVDALYEAAPVSPQFSQLREIVISEDSASLSHDTVGEFAADVAMTTSDSVGFSKVSEA